MIKISEDNEENESSDESNESLSDRLVDNAERLRKTFFGDDEGEDDE